MKEMGSSSPFPPKESKPTTTPTASNSYRSPAEKQSLSRRGNAFRCTSPCSVTSSSTSASHRRAPHTPNSSPSRSSHSVIPFSWEQQPGIPKNPRNHHPTTLNHPNPTLPLPPILRRPQSNTDVKKRSELGFVRDPFAVALMECSKEKNRSGEVAGEFWNGPTKALPTRRTMSDRFGFIGLYASCKASCSVVPSTVYIPRSGRPMVDYSLLSSRPD